MTTSELIESLSLPTAYPFASNHVQVCQTHISVVFLAGDFAYKVKKEVRLPFLDFSSLERRRFFCEREVELNRRLAPDVYLGVVPITRENGRLRFEGAGEVVEWAVKMCRLSDDDTLAARLRRNLVTPTTMRELASFLAEFHRTAATNDEITRFGRFELVAKNVRENLVAAAKFVGDTISDAVCRQLQANTEHALDQLRPLIERRVKTGCVRDTHGDLRLDHIYICPEADTRRWLIVDCIEFNDAFRYADPIADLAFLVMDLKSAGRADLARELDEAYLTDTKDDEGRALLPLYASYRAAVRAKVEDIELTEREIPTAEKTAARERACGHWLLALSELLPPQQRPGLAMVGGLPGTGKSTLAQRLREEAGFVVIRSDEVRKQLAGVSPQQSAAADFQQGIYTPEWTDRTYAECLRQAEQRLFEGQRVVVDATFSAERHRREFQDVARRWCVPSAFLICELPSQTVRERLQRRHGDVSDADWSVYCNAVAVWEPPSAQTARHVYAIDTSTQAAAQAEAHVALVTEGLAE